MARSRPTKQQRQQISAFYHELIGFSSPYFIRPLRVLRPPVHWRFHQEDHFFQEGTKSDTTSLSRGPILKQVAPRQTLLQARLLMNSLNVARPGSQVCLRPPLARRPLTPAWREPGLPAPGSVVTNGSVVPVTPVDCLFSFPRNLQPNVPSYFGRSPEFVVLCIPPPPLSSSRNASGTIPWYHLSILLVSQPAEIHRLEILQV